MRAGSAVSTTWKRSSDARSRRRRTCARERRGGSSPSSSFQTAREVGSIDPGTTSSNGPSRRWRATKEARPSRSAARCVVARSIRANYKGSSMSDRTIIDATDASFQADVIEESFRRPVVIDFWAAWCAPCRALGPLLERLAEEAGGAFLLAKVNVDENPALARAFHVRGIPAVHAVRNGKVVDAFTGALPEFHVRKWLEGILPGPEDALLAQAAELQAQGKVE